MPKKKRGRRRKRSGGEETRDVFLSHRGADKEFVRRLAADIESTPHEDRHLTAWVDEAEIRPGQSIPGLVNEGLERSRFIALVMTPAYFDLDGSGWTHAEWHAALHTDPDNRRARIVPILAADCPYVPMLLRHLLSLDLRGSHYPVDLERLRLILRGEPLPRPATHRGQLIRGSGRIDRTTLMAERAVPEGDPDVVRESLSCNLLPVVRLPTYVYVAPVRQSLRALKSGRSRIPTKEEVKEVVRQKQVRQGVEHPRVPAFRLVSGAIWTFHDLEDEGGLLAPAIDASNIEVHGVPTLLGREDDRRTVVSLLNMGISRHMMSCGLIADHTRGSRFFFPPNNGKRNEVRWRPYQKWTKRTVCKPYTVGASVQHWLHQAAYLKVVFFASRLFVQITPTWMLTSDGMSVRGGPEVGRVVIQWTGRERNMSVLYHVRFWTMMLRKGRPGPISIRMGDQSMEVATVPAFVEQQYGILHDRKDLLATLDEVAPLLAQQEALASVEVREPEDDAGSDQIEDETEEDGEA